MKTKFDLLYQSIFKRLGNYDQYTDNEYPSLGVDPTTSKKITVLTPKLKSMILTQAQLNKIVEINTKIANSNSLNGIDLSFFREIAERKPMILLANQNIKLNTQKKLVFVPYKLKSEISGCRRAITMAEKELEANENGERKPALKENQIADLQRVIETNTIKMNKLKAKLAEAKAAFDQNKEYPNISVMMQPNVYAKQFDNTGLPIGMSGIDDKGNKTFFQQNNTPWIPVISLFLTTYTPINDVVNYKKKTIDPETGEEYMKQETAITKRVIPLIMSLQETNLGVMFNKFKFTDKRANTYRIVVDTDQVDEDGNPIKQEWSVNQLKSDYTNIQAAALSICRKYYDRHTSQNGYAGDISILTYDDSNVTPLAQTDPYYDESEDKMIVPINGDTKLRATSLRDIWCGNDKDNFVINNVYNATLNRHIKVSTNTSSRIKNNAKGLFHGMLMESKIKPSKRKPR